MECASESFIEEQQNVDPTKFSPNTTYLRADVDTAPGATAAGAKAAADPARRAPRARVNFMVN